MDKARALLDFYYKERDFARSFLLPHSYAVAEFAIKIADRFDDIDSEFVYRAALLHDIGIFLTHAPSIGCFGDNPYISHGILGAEILRKEGLLKEAEICETHVGVAITQKEILENNLPLPPRDMIPLSKEEQLIAYSDKFFSKREEYLTHPKPLEVVLKELEKFGDQPVSIFMQWHTIFY